MDEQQDIASPVSLFYSYAYEDEGLRDELERHLSPLQRQGLIDSLHERQIEPGADWLQAIIELLNTASIILLLVSPDFIASDRHQAEIDRAMDRHRSEEAHVIPIILRPCDWGHTSFGYLECLPNDGRPVTTWENRDEAFQNVEQGIYQAVINRRSRGENREPSTPSPPQAPSQLSPKPLGCTRRKIIWTAGGLALAVSVSVELVRLLNQSPISPHRSPVSLLYTYHGHKDVVEAVAWSPNGTRVASCSWDKTVQVWEATDGDELTRYEEHTDEVYAVAWSPDSQYIASAAWDGTVQVWNATNGKLLLTHWHPNRLYAVAWSPNGTYIASGGLEKSPTPPAVHIWYVATGQLLKICQGHTQRIRHLAWSPDSQYIASCSEDGTVCVWNIVGGTLIDRSPTYTYPAHTDVVESVVWAPDGKRIAFGSRDTTVRVWDAFTGRHTIIYQGHSQPVETVAWRPKSADPCIASGAEDSEVRVWRVADRTTLQTFYASGGKEVESVTWSPDGTRLAFGSADKTVQVRSLSQA